MLVEPGSYKSPDKLAWRTDGAVRRFLANAGEWGVRRLLEPDARRIASRGRREERVRRIGGDLLGAPPIPDVRSLPVALVRADPPAPDGLATCHPPGLGHGDDVPDVPDTFHGCHLLLLGCRHEPRGEDVPRVLVNRRGHGLRQPRSGTLRKRPPGVGGGAIHLLLGTDLGVQDIGVNRKHLAADSATPPKLKDAQAARPQLLDPSWHRV